MFLVFVFLLKPIDLILFQIHKQVILCANSRPALNDVVYNELTVLTKRVAAVSEVINNALGQGQLLVMESGQGSPCLDFRQVAAGQIVKDNDSKCIN